MNAFYYIDKPKGITSFDVLRKMKKILNIKKMGHTGTLDPLATGGLLVAVGNYTKLIPYFEKDTKEYEFKIMLDGTTPSYDCETEVTYISDTEKEKYKKELSLDIINKIIEENFSGEIEQIPPKYSALKIGGKKALDLVRDGKDFEMKKRKAIISNIEIISFSYPELHLKACVSAGTYIRSIANDLGEIIGSGGYITYLRRTKVGKLDISTSQTLENFKNENKYDLYELFGKERFINVSDEILGKLNVGLKLSETVLDIKEGIDYFIGNKDNVTNIIRKEDGLIKPVRRI